MKSFTSYILFFFLLLCLPIYGQKTTVITSKEVAVKKGIYSLPKEKSEVISEPKKTNSTNKKINKRKDKQRFSINTNNDEDIIVENDVNYKSEQIINNASLKIGTKYRSGGTSDEGYDCSGLMFSMFKKFDIVLPRSSHEMARVGKILTPSEYRIGDLIFFKTFGGNRISHVGMITEINAEEIKFIHSSTSLGVIISSTKEPYYERTFAQVNRILD